MRFFYIKIAVMHRLISLLVFFIGFATHAFGVSNPYTHFAAEFVQTNRWHKQQSVTRSTDEVRTAWDAISLCRQFNAKQIDDTSSS